MTFGQDVEYKDGKFSIVRDVKEATQKRIFNSAKEWIYKNYNSGDAVIQIEDPETGKITCTGRTQNLVYNNVWVKMDGGTFKYSLTTYCKDGKFKLLIDEITHSGGEMIQMRDGSMYQDEFPSKWGRMNKKQSQKEWAKMKDQARIEISAILLSMAKYITSPDKEAEFIP